MAIIKTAEVKNLSESEIRAKIKDLQLELIRQKSQKPGQSSTKIKMKEIRRAISRLYTRLNMILTEESEKGKKGTVRNESNGEARKNNKELKKKL